MKKTIKIIDLLNKIANGEEVPKKIRIDHWCYNFEWVEHDSNYYDKHEDIDLMSCLSMSEEELNYGVQIIEEDKKIEKLETHQDSEGLYFYDKHCKKIYITCDEINFMFEQFNEIIDAINELKGKSE